MPSSLNSIVECCFFFSAIGLYSVFVGSASVKPMEQHVEPKTPGTAAAGDQTISMTASQVSIVDH